MMVQHPRCKIRNGKETNSDAAEAGRTEANGAKAAIQTENVSALSLRRCVVRTLILIWEQAIPSGSVGQIENGICPKNIHADREHEGRQGRVTKSLGNTRLLWGLSLEIITVRLDVAILSKLESRTLTSLSEELSGGRSGAFGYLGSCFHQVTVSCRGGCIRARRVCRFNWLTR
jgi:hypothetical protein